MIFDQDTVAIGLSSFNGETTIIELKAPRDCFGRTFNQVIFLKEPDLEDQPLWYNTAMTVTIHTEVANNSNRITRLKV